MYCAANSVWLLIVSCCSLTPNSPLWLLDLGISWRPRLVVAMSRGCSSEIRQAIPAVFLMSPQVPLGKTPVCAEACVSSMKIMTRISHLHSVVHSFSLSHHLWEVGRPGVVIHYVLKLRHELWEGKPFAWVCIAV